LVLKQTNKKTVKIVEVTSYV